MLEPSQKPPPATADPVTTVMSKLPAEKGDVGAFLVSYGVGYIAVETLAAGLGLPPPITTAALLSGIVVGVKNIIQALRAKSHPSPSKKDLAETTERFEQLLADEGRVDLHDCLKRAESLWHAGVDSDAVYEAELNQLSASYKSVTKPPAIGEER